ncbi:CLUMA_CG015479, isoform A [Clunio marinus]|uniref:CLUMA_CG015479, isoform A n=1 Tax=Clunio marinus TaxID=568069 RepID=A0A1J1IPG3_9DIPT|nr:CLUMA_CG015479, isoform A [Clunio marinus]
MSFSSQFNVNVMELSGCRIPMKYYFRYSSLRFDLLTISRAYLLVGKLFLFVSIDRNWVSMNMMWFSHIFQPTKVLLKIFEKLLKFDSVVMEKSIEMCDVEKSVLHDFDS